MTARARDIDAETRIGEIYMRSLMRAQRRLGIVILIGLGGGLAGVPLAFHLHPGLAEITLFGLPLAWVLLGLAVYPFLLLLGGLYIRAAERNEVAFIDLVNEPDLVNGPDLTSQNPSV